MFTRTSSSDPDLSLLKKTVSKGKGLRYTSNDISLKTSSIFLESRLAFLLSKRRQITNDAMKTWNTTGVRRKFRKVKSIHIVEIFCFLYSLYLLAGIIFSICRYLRRY